MKKKLLLVAFAAAMLMCFFTIVVSAATVPDWTEITEVAEMSDKSVFGEDGMKGATSRVLMSDGITYPAYYICKNQTSLAIDFTEINKNASKSYSKVNVVRIEIPKGTISTPDAILKADSDTGFTALVTAAFPEGFTTLGGYTFKSTDKINSSLTYVTLPSTLKTIGQQAFIYCNQLKELIIPDGVETISPSLAAYTTSLVKVVLPSSLKKIESLAFRSSAISCDIVIPEGCTEIQQHAFAGTSVTSVVVPSTLEKIETSVFKDCLSLTKVHYKAKTVGGNMFQNCDAISELILENTTEIGEHAFNVPSGKKSGITTLVLPNTLTKIGQYAFARCGATTIIVPASVTDFGTEVFKGSSVQKLILLGSTMTSNMLSGCSSMTELVITENFTTYGSGGMANVSGTKFTTYYTGTDYTRIKEIMGNSSTGTSRVKDAKFYSYETFSSGTYNDKYTFIYGINLCDAAFGGVHTEPMDDGNCQTSVICTFCNEYVFKAALEHAISEAFTYENYMLEGEYRIYCGNDGCQYGSTKKTPALFVCLGYSVSEVGLGGIAIGYTVNDVAIKEYTDFTGGTLKYGVFAVAKEKLGDNDIFGSDGTVANGAICVEISQFGLSAFEIHISGFSDEYKDAKIAMGAYVALSDDEATEYSYMQEDVPNQGEKYCFASYNDVIEKTLTDKK